MKYITLLIAALLSASLYAETAKMANIVCFVKFSDQADQEFEHDFAYYEKMMNDRTSGANSVVNYFTDMSYGKFDWESTIIPFVYIDSHPRAYFLPKTESNPDGYTMLDVMLNTRTNTLVRDMCAAISSHIPEGTLLDANGDSRVDNLVVILCGDSDTSASNMLWPKNAIVSTAYINGVQCKNYLMVFDGANGFYTPVYGDKQRLPLTTGILCHEMMHTLDAYDLYTSSGNPKLQPVNVWDLMSDNNSVPQSLSAYIRSTYGNKYGDWLPSKNIVEITGDGNYTVAPINSPEPATVAYKIVPDNTKSEYFMIEYRDRSNMWDTSLPNGGLLVYRVYPGMRGNTGASDKYEMYVFRPGGTTQVAGYWAKAPLGPDTGRTEFGTPENADYPFYSDGSRANFAITDVKVCEGGMNFNVSLTNGAAVDEIPIDSFEGTENIYTLQGMRLNCIPGPGIYIVNGRKVLIRK